MTILRTALVGKVGVLKDVSSHMLSFMAREQQFLGGELVAGGGVVEPGTFTLVDVPVFWQGVLTAPPKSVRLMQLIGALAPNFISVGVPMHLFAALLVLTLVGSTEVHANNAELARLAAQDQADRDEKNGQWDDDAR